MKFYKILRKDIPNAYNYEHLVDAYIYANAKTFAEATLVAITLPKFFPQEYPEDAEEEDWEGSLKHRHEISKVSDNPYEKFKRYMLYKREQVVFDTFIDATTIDDFLTNFPEKSRGVPNLHVIILEKSVFDKLKDYRQFTIKATDNEIACAYTGNNTITPLNDQGILTLSCLSSYKDELTKISESLNASLSHFKAYRNLINLAYAQITIICENVKELKDYFKTLETVSAKPTTKPIANQEPTISAEKVAEFLNSLPTPEKMLTPFQFEASHIEKIKIEKSGAAITFKNDCLTKDTPSQLVKRFSLFIENNRCKSSDVNLTAFAGIYTLNIFGGTLAAVKEWHAANNQNNQENHGTVNNEQEPLISADNQNTHNKLEKLLQIWQEDLKTHTNPKERTHKQSKIHAYTTIIDKLKTNNDINSVVKEVCNENSDFKKVLFKHRTGVGDLFNFIKPLRSQKTLEESGLSKEIISALRK